jgi:hypothetical protein
MNSVAIPSSNVDSVEAWRRSYRDTEERQREESKLQRLRAGSTKRHEHMAELERQIAAWEIDILPHVEAAQLGLCHVFAIVAGLRTELDAYRTRTRRKTSELARMEEQFRVRWERNTALP